MEIGDIVLSEGRKGVVTRVFSAGIHNTPHITAWFGNSMLTAPAESVTQTDEKCPAIKCVLFALGLLGEEK